jgi:hypothetical protein
MCDEETIFMKLLRLWHIFRENTRFRENMCKTGADARDRPKKTCYFCKDLSYFPENGNSWIIFAKMKMFERVSLLFAEESPRGGGGGWGNIRTRDLPCMRKAGASTI